VNARVLLLIPYVMSDGWESVLYPTVRLMPVVVFPAVLKRPATS
jgi:hypothetical protein